jgi:hypothetical protein
MNLGQECPGAVPLASADRTTMDDGITFPSEEDATPCSFVAQNETLDMVPPSLADVPGVCDLKALAFAEKGAHRRTTGQVWRRYHREYPSIVVSFVDASSRIVTTTTW